MRSILLFTALALLGLVLIPRLGVQLHPSATMPSMRITFSWMEVPAINIEREVTSKIEASMATLRDVEDINSVSMRGQGSVEIRFKEGTEMEMARFEIASRIRRLYPGFPEKVSYPAISVSRASGHNSPLLTYTLAAPATSQKIAEYIENTIIPSMSQIKGVDQLEVYGVNPSEFQLIYNTRVMELYGISTTDINNALHNHFGQRFLGMGDFTFSNNGSKVKLPVMLRSAPTSDLQWRQIPVAKTGEKIIYLEDVAKMQMREQEVRGYYRINGKSTLMITIYAVEGANQIQLSNFVKEEMQGITTQIPEQWQVILTYDDTEFIRKDLRKVGYRMLMSLIILLVFVLLVSRQVKYLFMIFVTLLANLLIAVTGYHFFDIQIHLYSLAGITVSFGILIDNTIVMIEHIRLHKNKKVFLAILAATLTTLGSLSVIFLLSDQQQAQLGDFAAVILVNLSISLVIAWFFIPAIMSSIDMRKSGRRQSFKRLRRQFRSGMLYFATIKFSRRYRWLVLTVLILGFGIPLHLLPPNLDEKNHASKLYNSTIGSNFYQRNIKTISEKVLGGSFRLFSRFVYERSYFADPERTTLYVRGQMPDGATIHQLNESMIQMEQFLASYPEIEQFQTRVTSPEYGIITILFHPEHDQSGFPYILQGSIIQKAINIGGAEWNVWGVGQGFSNVLISQGGNSSIVLEGYNYDQLYRYAQKLEERAGDNPRVNKITISGGNPWQGKTRNEFFLQINPGTMALHQITLYDLFDALDEKIMFQNGPPITYKNTTYPLRLVSDIHREYSVWDIENQPMLIRDESLKINRFVSLNKKTTGNDIYKYNQQYRLNVNFNFAGPHLLEERVKNQLIEEISAELPTGYTAKDPVWDWQQEEESQYLLILLVIAIIYFVCAILLESLLQPLAIIGLIPVSFIGLFLTFYLFDLNFDQGGWAAFILLSGLSVNAGLYILNDFNNFRNQYSRRHHIRLYLKAFQYKITPVLLTILSTVIGLIPFVVGQREAFWFAFAAGTMGGLVFSLFGIFFFLPVFLRMKS